MVTINERRLSLFPDSLAGERRREAELLAVRHAGKGFAVKLFVEGLLPADGRMAALGATVHAVEDSRIRGPVDIARALAALHRLNAFRWGLANVQEGAFFLASTLRMAQKYGGVHPDLKGPEALDAALEFLTSDFADAASSMIRMGIITVAEAGPLASVVVTPSQAEMPDLLLEMGRRLLGRIQQQDLDHATGPGLAEVREFFRARHRIRINMNFGSLNIASLSEQLLSMRKPLPARDLAASLEARLYTLRELRIAHSVAVQEFGVGILCVYMPAFGMPNLSGLLTEAGMDVKQLS